MRNTTEEYQNQIHLTYSSLVEHLLEKYGAAKEDYFTNESCISKNRKVSRTKEGLVCHHIDEDKAIRLSNDQYAKKNPFSYQKAERLVYCNLLEHLLLHIKITEKPRDINANTNEFLGIGGAIQFICRELNDFYSGQTPTQQWKERLMQAVIDNYDDYIIMLQYLWEVVQKDPRYKGIITKEDLAKDWNGNIVTEIYNRL